MPVKRSRSPLEELNVSLSHIEISTDPESLETYGRDWTRYYTPRPLAAVFPRSVEDVREVVLFANRTGIGLVPSGGRTGLSGGAVAANGEIVVSFDRMDKIIRFNPLDRTVRVEAGVITETLIDYADSRNLFFPIDFASRGSSRIGGNIATNAGGIKVVRYGLTRDWVAGLKVVTGKGDVMELNHGLVKNATGYDLRHLFIGSEGTLGFIVEATLRLTRKTGPRQAILLAVPHLDAVMDVMLAFRDRIELNAYEFFSHAAMSHVIRKTGLQSPFNVKAPFYTLIEFDNLNETVMEQALSLFEECSEKGWILDGVVSESDAQLKKLWRFREDISESISEFLPYKNDISVTISSIPQFLRELDDIVVKQYPDFEVLWYGHIADGNLHLNILKPGNMTVREFENRCKPVNTIVFDTVRKYNGSVSAEHGVGLLKKPYLNYSRSPQEIEYMRLMKMVFDPEGIMNPGKIFDTT